MSAGIGLTKKSLLSLAVAALPLALFGCGGGGGGGDDVGGGGGSGPGSAAQVNATAVQDSVVWVANTVPGCKLNAGAANAASVASAQDGLAGVGVVQQVISVVKQARKAGGSGISPMAAQRIDGDCGGSLNISDVHASGITTYTYAFNNFCSLDTTVTPSQKTVLNGSAVSREIGTPSPSGPIVSSSDLSVDKLTMTAKDGTTEISVSGATVTYGVPATWGPGEATASKPDQFNVSRATVKLANQNRTHNLSNLRGTTYVSGENDVMSVSSGRYETTSHGYVDLATGQPIVMNEDGRWVSGSLNLAGADGKTVVATPSAGKAGVVNVALDGQTLGASLDCSGASSQLPAE